MNAFDKIWDSSTQKWKDYHESVTCQDWTVLDGLDQLDCRLFHCSVGVELQRPGDLYLDHNHPDSGGPRRNIMDRSGSIEAGTFLESMSITSCDDGG